MTTPDRRGPSARLSSVVRILDIVDRKIVIPIVAAALILMALVISADAFYRYLLDDSLDFAPKVATKLLMVLIIFGGLNDATRHRVHVRVDVLTDRFPKRVDEGLTIIWDCVIVILLATIAYQCYQRGMAASNALIGAFDIPPRVSLLLIAVGCTLAAVRLALATALRLMGVDPDSAEPPLAQVV